MLFVVFTIVIRAAYHEEYTCISTMHQSYLNLVPRHHPSSVSFFVVLTGQAQWQTPPPTPTAQHPR